MVAKAVPTDGGGFAEYLTTAAQFGIAHIPTGLGHATAGLLGLADLLTSGGRIASTLHLSAEQLADRKGNGHRRDGLPGSGSAHRLASATASGRSVYRSLARIA